EPATTSTETTINVRRGVLVIGRRERIETTYSLKSKADKAKTVLIEHPFQAQYKLVAPATALERTALLYRFDVALPPGKSGMLKGVVERPISQGFGLVDADLDTLINSSTGKQISPAIRTA